ncbi:MAG: hypothetical protein F4Y07_12915 [Gemmatimonadetes bacterium]|nr:hypothetical protein [Gemmatimonadota bacterium]MYB07820.1 hypothetical protein [Gemmatimonadota bacterium]MYE17369.1 hypothetical protein [Gemmatimonadota bacterium]MYG20925.1 hypothetical protein [Gemmatimonadota bacterium]MYJ39228.1 hypothetical protein [Gemmatimonadota bacterium]
MSSDQSQAAEARFAEALAATGARDPRDYYREKLRELKLNSPEGYAEGVAYYQQTLIPSIAGGEADPLEAWRDYGLLIARLTVPGRPVAIDAGGRSRPFQHPGDPGDMVLHMPDTSRARPVLVTLPAKPSEAQLATFDWLVAGRRALRGA